MKRLRMWKNALIIFIYKKLYRIEVGKNGTMAPQLGKGKYKSVYRKYDIIDIIDEETQNIIRLVPYQPNHGVMIERWKDGKIYGRCHKSFEDFWNDGWWGDKSERKA